MPHFHSQEYVQTYRRSNWDSPQHIQPSLRPVMQSSKALCGVTWRIFGLPQLLIGLKLQMPAQFSQKKIQYMRISSRQNEPPLLRPGFGFFSCFFPPTTSRLSETCKKARLNHLFYEASILVPGLAKNLQWIKPRIFWTRCFSWLQKKQDGNSQCSFSFLPYFQPWISTMENSPWWNTWCFFTSPLSLVPLKSGTSVLPTGRDN